MNERHRIPVTVFATMVGVAGAIDALAAMLTPLIIGFALNSILSMLAWVLFYIWFQIQSVKFLEGGLRKAIIYFGGGFLELIPIINILPIWTLTVVLTIFIVRVEDAEYNKKMIEATV